MKRISIHAPHIYVAGPMGKPEMLAENCRRAIELGDEVFKLGAVPHIPHLTVAWHAVRPHEYEEWLDLDFAVIARCDAVYRIPGESPGANREVVFAEQHQIPVLVDLLSVRLFIAGWLGRGSRNTLGGV